MQKNTNDWKQEGRVFVWRYRKPGRKFQGWHFSGDFDGCANIVQLLEILFNSDGAYRTLKLEPLSEVVWGASGFGKPANDRFERLRIRCDEAAEQMVIAVDDDLLEISGARRHLESLWTGYVSLTLGDGDFGTVPPSAKEARPLMFWWAIPNQAER